jgi:UDP-N-acetylglucosamine 4,6-dehydratase
MFNDKSILVTGGTGSFGQKFAEIILKEYSPRRLIVFSRDELKQHEMRQRFPERSLRFFIGDVRDRDRLRRAFADVDFVIHAAALKQVPACEYNPFEAVQTNIIGAQNIIEAAIDTGVGKILAISTDKAVNPVNLYGATKLCSEKLFVQGNTYAGLGGTIFSCARYGNVVGSRGSVIPIFKEQREQGTLSVTDDRMTRFWITLDQGVRFVIQCMEIMNGGEIFVPKIPSMSIMDLVKSVAPECKVEITGIRPGEKLHEVLVSEDEARHALEGADMFIIQPSFPTKRDVPEYPGTSKAPDGYRYTSDTNPVWLDKDEIAELVQSVK